jgi:hypothetical protein
MDYPRFFSGDWLPVLLAAWILRFEEREEWEKNFMARVKAWRWWLNRLWEAIAIGFLFGDALIYLFDQYSVIAWSGSDDAFMPGIGWSIALGLGGVNWVLRLLVNGKNARRLGDALVMAGLAFFISYVLLHNNAGGVALISIAAGFALLIVAAAIGLMCCFINAIRLVPLDLALSVAIPVDFVFLIWGVDQFPVLGSVQLSICFLIGLLGWFVRGVLWNRYVFKEDELRCCVGCRDKPTHTNAAEVGTTDISLASLDTDRQPLLSSKPSSGAPVQFVPRLPVTATLPIAPAAAASRPIKPPPLPPRGTLGALQSAPRAPTRPLPTGMLHVPWDFVDPIPIARSHQPRAVQLAPYPIFKSRPYEPMHPTRGPYSDL